MNKGIVKEDKNKKDMGFFDDVQQLVVFRLADEEFGVDINRVREIIKMSAITRVPYAPSFVEGVINLRGQITTVVDLRKILNLPHHESSLDTRIIIIELENGVFGIIVDSVAEVLRIPKKDIDPTPTITGDVNVEYIKGVGKLNKRLLILLDMNKVFESLEVV